MGRFKGSSWLKALVHVCALAPLVWLLWGLAQGQLTANPVREIQLRTGIYTLNLLVLTLACAPVYNMFALEPALQLRRRLGLYAFGYAGLHFLAFIGLDYAFNLVLVWEDIADKRFVIAGLAAFLILLALAITSTEGWKRRLGKNWKRLHRLIYAAALLAAFHFVWQTRVDFRLPLVYTGAVVVLLTLRLPRVKKSVRWRGRWQQGPDGPASADEI